MPTERTALAWERSAASLATLAAVFIGAAAHRNEPWAIVFAAGFAIAAALAWRHGRRAYRRRNRLGASTVPAPDRALALLALTTLVAAVAAAVAVVL